MLRRACDEEMRGDGRERDVIHDGIEVERRRRRKCFAGVELDGVVVR